MSLAIKGQGASISVGGQAIAEVTKIQRSGAKADFADVTNFQSVGAYREVLPTLLDPGEISCDANYLGNQSAAQTLLQTEFDAQTLGNWTIVLPPKPGTTTGSAGQWAFTAYVSSVDFDLPLDKEAKLSFKLKLTGKPVFT